MPLPWMELAAGGVPPPDESIGRLLRLNKRKTFAPPPTVSPHGELVVTPAVFKPRPCSVKPADSAVNTSITSTAKPHKQPTTAVNSAPAIRFLVPDNDDDTFAAKADYFELMDELTAKHSCDAVRRKIQRLLARKTMTPTVFLKEINTNSNSFRKFMSYKGRDKGHGNNTYTGALLFFEGFEKKNGDDRLIKGYEDKTPKVSRRTQADQATVFFGKINAVALPEPVYVFDDCDDVRKKLNELIESNMITQSAIFKHLDVNSNSLRKFLTTTGKSQGCSMNVYKLAYIMFEKLRIAEGRAKTSKRLKHEKELPEGFSLKREPRGYYFVPVAGAPPVMNAVALSSAKKRKTITPSKSKAKKTAAKTVSPADKAPAAKKQTITTYTAPTTSAAPASAPLFPVTTVPSFMTQRAMPPLHNVQGGNGHGLPPFSFAGGMPNFNFPGALPSLNMQQGYQHQRNVMTLPSFNYSGGTSFQNYPPFNAALLSPLPLEPLPIHASSLNYGAFNSASFTSQGMTTAPTIDLPTLNLAAVTSAPQTVAPLATATEIYDSESTTSEDDEEREVIMDSLTQKWDCNAIRREIQKFLARKIMTQTAFLAIIHANSNSYRNFMSYKQKYQGSNNQTYDGALWFFYKLEKKEAAAKEKEAAAKKRAPKAKAGTTSATAEAGAAKPPSRQHRNAKMQELFDKINVVTLEEPVNVYDDCDEIRKKIHEITESKTVTQAALLRELDVNSNSLRRYLTTKGKREGCSNGVYYRAYCFFEKLRIAENKPKTAKRVKMENELPIGYSLQRDPTHCWVFVGHRK